MKVAVIIVNYGTPDLSIAAVESVLARDHGGHEIEIHLVDNASPGNDAAIFEKAKDTRNWHNVTLWMEEENHGFGRGNNVVLRSLAAQEEPPDYVFLLNPDAELTNEAIAILVDALEVTPDAAAAGAAVSSQAVPATAAFRFPTPLSELMRIIDFGPLDRAFGKHSIYLPPDHPTGPVDWVAAAAVLFRLNPLVEVGFFDPKFFLYYEEVELMHRLRKAGWQTIYVPKAQICHIEGASTGGGGRRRDQPSYLYDSWRHYFSITYGRRVALALSILLWLAGPLNVLHRRIRGKAPTVPVNFLFDQWRLVIWPLLTKANPEV